MILLQQCTLILYEETF